MSRPCAQQAPLSTSPSPRTTSIGNTATSYAGTVGFTSSDAAAVLPSSGSLTSGSGTFRVTFKTSGNQTLAATDTVTSSITGTSGAVAVSPAVASVLSVVAPANTIAGTAFNATVTARDAYGNTATGYTGTVHFTSTDGSATLPGNGTLTSGVGTFSITLTTAGHRSVAATDTAASTITGSSGDIVVAAAAATHFASYRPGQCHRRCGLQRVGHRTRPIWQYRGWLCRHGASHQQRWATVLPADSTLTGGTGTFSVTLKTAGNQTITAADSITSTITGTSGPLANSPAAATHFTVERTGQRHGRHGVQYHRHRARRL